MLLGVSSTTRMAGCMAFSLSSSDYPDSNGGSMIFTALLVEPGHLEHIPSLHRRHLERDDARIIGHVFGEPFHHFGGPGLAQLVTHDLKAPVFPAARHQEPARHLGGVEV